MNSPVAEDDIVDIKPHTSLGPVKEKHLLFLLLSRVQSAKRGALQDLEDNRDCVYFAYRQYYDAAIEIVKRWFNIPDGEEKKE